ncbi:MAG: Chorismate mutase II, partial [uncultured Thermomicrobiales bacterium]
DRGPPPHRLSRHPRRDDLTDQHVRGYPRGHDRDDPGPDQAQRSGARGHRQRNLHHHAGSDRHL